MWHLGEAAVLCDPLGFIFKHLVNRRADVLLNKAFSFVQNTEAFEVD
jgi:hypothetical protein